MRPEEIVEILAVVADLGHIPFEPGEGLAFSLTLTDGSDLGLEIDPDGQTLLLSSPLFSVPPADRAAVFAEAMQLNYINRSTSGTALGWDPRTGYLVLSALIPLPLLDEGTLLGALNAFAELAVTMRESLPVQANPATERSAHAQTGSSGADAAPPAPRFSMLRG